MDFDDYAAKDGLALAELVRSGDVKPAELLDAALARIRKAKVRDVVARGLRGDAHRRLQMLFATRSQGARRMADPSTKLA